MCEINAKIRSRGDNSQHQKKIRFFRGIRKKADQLIENYIYASTFTNAAADFAFCTISSTGVSNISETSATPILLYGLEVGFPNRRKSVLGNPEISSIPVNVGFSEFSDANITALAPAFSNLISKIGRLK